MEIVAFWFICAVIAAIIASSRGRSGVGWFFLGLLISIFAIILVAILPSKKVAPVVVGGEVATPETHVRCPWCKGLVRKDASVCMHCRKELTPQQIGRRPDIVLTSRDETPVMSKDR
jgi:hypothetical protein